MVSFDDEHIVSEFRPRLEAAFGTRLRGIRLYGSRARGDAQPDSDLDLMVLLDGPVEVVRDVRTIVDALYPLQLRVDYPIHAIAADVRHYEAGEFAIYRHVREDAVPL